MSNFGMTPTISYKATPATRLSVGRLTLRGSAITYLFLMIVLPLAALIKTGFGPGLKAFVTDFVNPVALASLKLTLVSAILVTLINAFIGTMTAYALVRFEFPGKRILDAIVDVAFAIPTLVTGVMLVALYGPQTIIGSWLGAHGIEIVFAQPGIIIALLFVTYPFVIRSVQPVLKEFSLDQEEAAYTIGASNWTTFRAIVLPTIAPAITSGCLLSFARALGEFGSIVIVAGNIPFRTLSAPVYVFGQVESQNSHAASSVSLVLLAVSFTLMLTVEALRKSVSRS
jgi:sulfate transport system permease protein